MIEKEFRTSELDSWFSVLGVSASDPLNTFAEIWFHLYMWTLFSSIFVHIGAGLASVALLWKHPKARCVTPVFLLSGLLTPVLYGAVSSAAIAFVYRASAYPLEPFYALILGVSQTVLGLGIAFSRILATL